MSVGRGRTLSDLVRRAEPESLLPISRYIEDRLRGRMGKFLRIFFWREIWIISAARTPANRTKSCKRCRPPPDLVRPGETGRSRRAPASRSSAYRTRGRILFLAGVSPTTSWEREEALFLRLDSRERF